MIELYKFGPVGSLCDPSPFCVKVETYLRMTGLAYKTHNGAKYLRESPKDKLPYIKDDGKVVADSSFIFSYLKETYGDDLDGPLTKEQRAVAHSFTKMIDENLYWSLVHARWILDHNWVIIRGIFFGTLPFPLRLVIPNMVRKNVLKGMKGHGIGRHSKEEIEEIAAKDLQALSDILGDKTYFFGDRPSTLDAAAFGILSQMILSDTFTAPVFDEARKHKNLVDFSHRIQKKYFADLP